MIGSAILSAAGRRTGIHLVLRFAAQRLVMRFHRRVALASRLLQAVQVENLDASAAIFDQAGPPKGVRDIFLVLCRVPDRRAWTPGGL
jgi:hypothetical protein